MVLAIGEANGACLQKAVQRLAVVSGEGRNHPFLDVGDSPRRLGENVGTVRRECQSLATPLAVDLDEACLAKPDQQLVGGLAAGEDSAGELGVGDAWPMMQQLEAGVLRRCQSERAELGVHGAA